MDDSNASENEENTSNQDETPDSQEEEVNQLLRRILNRVDIEETLEEYLSLDLVRFGDDELEAFFLALMKGFFPCDDKVPGQLVECLQKTIAEASSRCSELIISSMSSLMISLVLKANIPPDYRTLCSMDISVLKLLEILVYYGDMSSLKIFIKDLTRGIAFAFQNETPFGKKGTRTSSALQILRLICKAIVASQECLDLLDEKEIDDLRYIHRSTFDFYSSTLRTEDNYNRDGMMVQRNVIRNQMAKNGSWSDERIPKKRRYKNSSGVEFDIRGGPSGVGNNTLDAMSQP